LLENNEIKALLHLLDDPDEDVYQSVSDKIVSFGKAIIPNLEHLWENENRENVQERIESLIHRLHFRDLSEEFDAWLKDEKPGLISGAMIIAKYHYPEIQAGQILSEIEKIRRNVWIELNAYLTPMERVSIFNSILYNYYKQIGVEMSYDNPDQFLINKSLENKSGNAISNGIIYLILCHLLDISVQAVRIPGQFILAYFEETPSYTSLSEVTEEKRILFFIDPLNGQLYSKTDVENYFKKTDTPFKEEYFSPRDNKSVIRFLLLELSKCFENDNNRYKMEELRELANRIES